MIKQRAKTAALLLLITCLSGCGTINARTDNGLAYRSDYYKSTKADIKILGGLDSAGYVTMVCYLTIVCPFAVLASVPVDLAVDTLLLPYDYARADRSKEMSYKQAESKSEYGYLKFDFNGAGDVVKSDGLVSYSVVYEKENKRLNLFVSGATVKNAALKVPIPAFKGYALKSISVYYGIYSRAMLVVSCGAVNAASASDAVKDEASSFNGQGLIYYDGGNTNERRKSKVVITPFINCEGARISVGSVPTFNSHAY